MKNEEQNPTIEKTTSAQEQVDMNRLRMHCRLPVRNYDLQKSKVPKLLLHGSNSECIWGT